MNAEVAPVDCCLSQGVQFQRQAPNPSISPMTPNGLRSLDAGYVKR